MTLTLTPGRQVRSRGDLLFGLADPVSTRIFTEGSILIKSDGPGIIGDVIFGDPIAEAFLAALPLETSTASKLVFSEIVDGSLDGGTSYFTGVAIYKPGSEGIQTTFRVFDE